MPQADARLIRKPTQRLVVRTDDLALTPDASGLVLLAILEVPDQAASEARQIKTVQKAIKDSIISFRFEG